jgi:hypothetical protein
MQVMFSKYSLATLFLWTASQLLLGCDADDAIAVKEIDHEVFQENFEITVKATGIGGPEQSYWYLEFDDGAYAGLKVNAWCVDIMRFMGDGTYKMDSFSAYDDFHTDAVDNPQNLPMINYLIKRFPLGTMVSEGECTGVITWTEFQYAVWTIIDDYTILATDWVEEPWGGYPMVECVKEYIVLEAMKHGADYEPSCDDPNAEIAVILIVDNDSDVIENQVIVAEILLSSLDACKIKDCDEPTIRGPTLLCVEEINMRETSDTICPDTTDVVQYVGHVGNNAFKELIDDMDIIYDLDFTAQGTLTFKVMNPFSEDAVDFYVVADIPEGDVWAEECLEDVFDGATCADESDTFEAYCHLGYAEHGERARTYINVYFQSNATVIENGGAEVDECCHSDPNDGAPVVKVTFLIYCECPPAPVSRALLRGA